MIKEILVCLEGSPSTDAATMTAIEIARERKAKLVGLAIVDEPDIRAGAATGIGGSSFKHERDESLIADARKHAADWITLFERRCRDAKVTGKALEVVGRPAASILAETDKRDLTVIGRDANFRFETEQEDSETREAILHRATRPVLLVPENAARAIGKKVVIAYDGSGDVQRAPFGEEAWVMASKGAELLKESNLSATIHNLVSPLSNVDALFNFAAEMGAGMMVMGAFASSRLRQLFKGSVTRGLVEKTTIPLYLQH